MTVNLATAAEKPAVKKPAFTYLKDYRPCEYLVRKTQLHVSIYPDKTRVSSCLTIYRNPLALASVNTPAPLVLDGVNLTLKSVRIDGQTLSAERYQQDKRSLTIAQVPAEFTLECVTDIEPHNNTALVGLYQSQGLYCSQCEPEGFRRITYYIDQPENLSEFTTTIEADRQQCPVLLSNGNLIEQGIVANDPSRHWASWHDPFPKGAHLFALVAGKLEVLEDTYTTASGRQISLRIFAENKQDLAKCHHAMAVTQQAMAWDEQHYGREYDLDLFMIVVIAEFNIGGMENKGLNIYRADRLLIDPNTTTDADLQSMTETIAHEYFHNWTGNRVTGRDWFQLTLKEGWTTYRGRQFCHDAYSYTVKRIEEAQFLRSVQYAEDSSPLAHAIQPERYQAISNFYTPTVYRKGSDVVTMLRTLLGPAQYRAGSDLFFDRHDGQAATTDDFIQAMQEASGKGLSQFARWYAQVGTPTVTVESDYNPAEQTFTLRVKQISHQPSDQPLTIPLSIGLVGESGLLPLQLSDESSTNGITESPTVKVLEITQNQQTFIFEQVPERPVPSLFRDFSAPVHYHYSYSQADLLRVITQDPNGYCQWEACQRLWMELLKRVLDGSSNIDDPAIIPAALIAYYEHRLNTPSPSTSNTNDDAPAITAQLLTLPSLECLVESRQLTLPIDMVALVSSRERLKRQLAEALKPALAQYYNAHPATQQQTASTDYASMAQRALRNLALDYLVATEDPAWITRCQQHCQQAQCMSDTMTALSALVNSNAAPAQAPKAHVLAECYTRWRDQPLMINQWFKVQATCLLPGTLQTVKSLMALPEFSLKSPNKVHALIGSFCKSNPLNFHQDDGSGYAFIIDQVIALDALNPQLASQLLARSPLVNAPRYDAARQTQIQTQLQRLAQQPALSDELGEVLSLCLLTTQQGESV